MRPGVRSAHLHSRRQSMRVVNNTGVIDGTRSRLLQQNVVELRKEPRAGIHILAVNRPSIGKTSDRINKVNVAQELEVPGSRMNVAECDAVVAAEFARQLQAGVDGVGIAEVGVYRGHIIWSSCWCHRSEDGWIRRSPS